VWRTNQAAGGCHLRRPPPIGDLVESVRAGLRPARVLGEAMKLVGHKTRSMLDRYNIIDTRDLRAAAERLQGVAGNLEIVPRSRRAAVVGLASRRARTTDHQ
jgi:hypothetical protein